MINILELIHQRKPITLNTQGEQGKQFPDEHEFVIQLPAWVFREVEAYFEAQKSNLVPPACQGCTSSRAPGHCEKSALPCVRPVSNGGQRLRDGAGESPS